MGDHLLEVVADDVSICRFDSAIGAFLGTIEWL